MDALGTGGNKDCSLHAIRLANTQRADTVNFNLGPGAQTIMLTIDELVVSESATITGPGADKLTVRRSAAANTPRFRVLEVTAGTVSVSGLRISGGSSTFEGGGIRNRGTLTLNDCIVAGNTSNDGGHGINNDGQLIVNDCTIVGNIGRESVVAFSTTIQTTTIKQNCQQYCPGWRRFLTWQFDRKREHHLAIPTSRSTAEAYDNRGPHDREQPRVGQHQHLR